MDIPKNYLHDRLVLLLITIVSVVTVIGICVVLLRFDPSRNPIAIVGYRPNVSGTIYQPGKTIDIYSMAVYMIFTAAASIFLSAKTYQVRRFVSIFILAASIFLLILSTIVSNSLISIQ